MPAGDLRATLLRLTGAGRSRANPVEAKVQSVEARENYGLERLVISPGFTGAEPIPALFTHPLDGGPWPAVLYCHAHGGRYPLGKSELIDGRPSLQNPPYAQMLAENGIAALCLDMPCFENRQQPGESHRAKELLWQGKTLFGLMLDELAAGIDYLQSREDVPSDRIATAGLSMGCTHAWWLAALDDRVRAVASLCCLADIRTLVEAGTHDNHALYMVVPGLVDACDTGDVAALIAPRPHLSCVGMKDELTPPAAVEKVDKTLRAAYAAAGAPENWTLVVEPDSGHAETPLMRQRVTDFLVTQLRV
ncbi:MAG: dienelactone hydrolase family protein [Pseudomonadota bacterium]